MASPLQHLAARNSSLRTVCESDDMRVAFDIDGTIANNAHREHLARERKWDEFHALCHLDPPIIETMDVLRALAFQNNAHSIELWTARSDNYMASTLEWLRKYNEPFDSLKMRRKGDWRKACIIKLEWFLEQPPNQRPQLIFEDHPETTRLLRAAGARVHQVAEQDHA
jgi:hypothetical protein